MNKYAKFDQNIPTGSRAMSIFTKRPRPAEMMLGEASSPFAYQWLDNGLVYGDYFVMVAYGRTLL